MQVIDVDRVVIATDELEDTVERFEELLGIPFGGYAESSIPSQDGEDVIGGIISPYGIRVLSPVDDDEDNQLAQYIERNGSGLYGFCIRVADLDEAADELTEKGVEIISRYEEGEFKEMFLHPKTFNGTFVILGEYPHGVESAQKLES